MFNKGTSRKKCDQRSAAKFPKFSRPFGRPGSQKPRKYTHSRLGNSPHLHREKSLQLVSAYVGRQPPHDRYASNSLRHPNSGAQRLHGAGLGRSTYPQDPPFDGPLVPLGIGQGRIEIACPRVSLAGVTQPTGNRISVVLIGSAILRGIPVPKTSGVGFGYHGNPPGYLPTVEWPTMQRCAGLLS